MVKTVTLNTDIPASRELRITLPADVPTGSAKIVIMVSPCGSRPPQLLATCCTPNFLECGGIAPTSRIAGVCPETPLEFVAAYQLLLTHRLSSGLNISDCLIAATALKRNRSACKPSISSTFRLWRTGCRTPLFTPLKIPHLCPVIPLCRLARARRLDFQVEETSDHVRVTGRERILPRTQPTLTICHRETRTAPLVTRADHIEQRRAYAASLSMTSVPKLGHNSAFCLLLSSGKTMICTCPTPLPGPRHSAFRLLPKGRRSGKAGPALPCSTAYCLL